MSLILKGIDMPKDCDDCMFNFYREGDSCPACYLTKHIVLRKNEENIPTDCPLIEIVTCGECKHHDEDGWGYGNCQRPSVDYLRTADDDFCSYGERRTDEID